MNSVCMHELQCKDLPLKNLRLQINRSYLLYLKFYNFLYYQQYYIHFQKHHHPGPLNSYNQLWLLKDQKIHHQMYNRLLKSNLIQDLFSYQKQPGHQQLSGTMQIKRYCYYHNRILQHHFFYLHLNLCRYKYLMFLKYL